jgi:prepilin-type N-terminal cleavage/methylation domain-containing protein
MTGAEQSTSTNIAKGLPFLTNSAMLNRGPGGRKTTCQKGVREGHSTWRDAAENLPEGSNMKISGQWSVVSGQFRAKPQAASMSLSLPVSQSPSLSSRGFTLVELLVVMAIIAILSSLGAVVAYKALIHGKNAAIRMEIGQLDAALKAYKEKFGEYPPDGTDDNVTLQHVRRAFPQWTGSSLPGYLQNYNLNPQNALAFWLGGLPDAVTGVPSGFAADQTNPFQLAGTATGQCAARIKPFYEFDSSQLVNGTVSTTTMSSYCFWPRQAIGNKTSGALVYFRADNGAYTYGGGNKNCTDSGDTNSPKGKVYPAIDSRVSSLVWINSTSYQIFSAGLDTKFGALSSPINYPSGGTSTNSGQAYQSATYDDITNFSKGTLEGDIP